MNREREGAPHRAARGPRGGRGRRRGSRNGNRGWKSNAMEIYGTLGAGRTLKRMLPLALLCWIPFMRQASAFTPVKYAALRVVAPGLLPSRSPQSSPLPTPLYSSTPEELRLNPKKEGLLSTYGLTHKLYTALAAILFFMPDRTATARLASKWGGAAGYVLAAQSCRILQGATQAGRLSRDTYKRLNIGLIGFCLTFWAVPAEAGFLRKASRVSVLSFILCASKALGLGLALTGWQYGVEKEGASFFQPRVLLGEFWTGCWQTLSGLRVQYAKKALAYRNLLFMVLAGLVSSLLEGIFDVRYQEAFHRSTFDISIQWCAISRLFLIATMIYSLKDAAERDRLTGSTFIQMNLLVGGWALVVGFAQGLMGYWIEMLAFSLPFFIKAYRAHLERRQEKEETDGGA